MALTLMQTINAEKVSKGRALEKNDVEIPTRWRINYHQRIHTP